MILIMFYPNLWLEKEEEKVKQKQLCMKPFSLCMMLFNIVLGDKKFIKTCVILLMKSYGIYKEFSIEILRYN